jgi:hypothetical protein
LITSRNDVGYRIKMYVIFFDTASDIEICIKMCTYIIRHKGYLFVEQIEIYEVEVFFVCRSVDIIFSLLYGKVFY